MSAICLSFLELSSLEIKLVGYLSKKQTNILTKIFQLATMNLPSLFVFSFLSVFQKLLSVYFIDKTLLNKNRNATTFTVIIGCEFSKNPSTRTKDQISLALWLAHIIRTSSILKNISIYLRCIIIIC